MWSVNPSSDVFQGSGCREQAQIKRPSVPWHLLCAMPCLVFSMHTGAASITGSGIAQVFGTSTQITFTGIAAHDQGAATHTDYPVFPFSATDPRSRDFFVLEDAVFFLRGNYGDLGEKVQAKLTPHLAFPAANTALENVSAAADLTANDSFTILPDAAHPLGSLTTVLLSETLTGSGSGTWGALLQTKLSQPSRQLESSLVINEDSRLAGTLPAILSNNFEVVVGQRNIIDLRLNIFAVVDGGLIGATGPILPIESALNAFNSGHLTIDALGASIVTESGHDYAPSTTVPVPASFAMLGVGLAAVWARIRSSTGGLV